MNLETIDFLTPTQRIMAFSLAAQSGIFYSHPFIVTKPVKVPDELRLACARRGGQ